MRPTSTLDLHDPAVVADPYPALAEERSRHEVAWHEASGGWLAFSHAAVSAVQRNRDLGRLWRDREPAAELEPFNLLHRNQMMENEPPRHTRLRRPVAAAFNRGHVERLRPRVRSLADELLDALDPTAFDLVRDFAEPLPVLVICELLGVPASMVGSLRAWSQAIVRMYEPGTGPDVVDAAVRASADFAAYARELVAERRAAPRDDLVSDLARSELTDDEVVASVVLLLNAGHEASVNVFGNGATAMLRRGLVPGEDVALTVEECLRFDSALQLFERTATAPVEVGGVVVRPGEKVSVLLGSANRDERVFERADSFVVDRDPNPHVAFGVGVHFCLGAPLARMELAESMSRLWERFPRLALTGRPESRGTFVLRGHRSVPVAAE
ncbi:cytochrome P450 [Nocardioides marmoribigeumensis]|uniref:Unspecific monooxygenase n=1 Tax=Nocardioides marmoribigeumensis TaxID=433649 RepID=A0ABU2C005_9ACTN|nr:cytochrome P450 [Nocardioides marmoribigeumensis]MDR7363954.1 unspecific monooxygenase [Nocardioides marmoribigeumensis]